MLRCQRLKSLIKSEVMLECQGLAYTKLFWAWRPWPSTPRWLPSEKKLYYNRKRSEGLDLKERNKIWLLYKNFKSRWLSNKLNYIKLRLFRILTKVLNLIYKLNLPAKIKIYLVQHIEFLLYKMETYRGPKKDK